MTTDTTPFHDLAAFTQLSRVEGLALSADGDRLVAVVSRPDAKVSAYASSLWEIDLVGGSDPARLTRSSQGESSPVFLPNGDLLFVSDRRDPTNDTPARGAALWKLPAHGEAEPVADYPGPLRGPVVAADGSVLVASERPVNAEGDGADAWKQRDERKIGGILHTGMPVRHWDHELGAVSPRLLLLPAGGDELVDLVPDAVFELQDASYQLTPDGRTAVTTWAERIGRGRTRTSLAVIDVKSGERRLIPAADGAEYSGVKISPDGRRIATTRHDQGTFEKIMTSQAVVVDLDGESDPVVLDTGNVWVNELAWSPDGSRLLAGGDLNGRGVVLVTDPTTGAVHEPLVSDAPYSSLGPRPDGSLVALRSAVNHPPTPVVVSPGGTVRRLSAPDTDLRLPGRLEEVTATAEDGAVLRAWLCRPDADDADQPAPVMLWVHGGPFSSWNGWSWRWNPWVAVAQGWAVLLPDPALSTGYGPSWLARAWPHRAGLVWADLETVLDAALARPDLDAQRVACLGGSFGGYMTNWIAGHSDRFGAIVTHAGLWALDEEHTTTDMAEWKAVLWGTPPEHPEWYADNSPHHFADRIRTPMLVVHGNRDYRVPINQGLRLWWDLVSRFDGEPDQLPHRFLQYPNENHWVLSPANAEIWYDTVLGFCERHVLGRERPISPLL